MISMSVTYSIKLVAQQTGLSAHVIRIWEKRYGIIKPGRSGTGRRRFNDEDISRLRLLGRLTRLGHRIGDLAEASSEQLMALGGEKTGPGGASPDQVPLLVREAVEAVRALDAQRLEEVLERSAITYGQHGYLERVVSQLAGRLGEDWRAGTLSAAHEHMASQVIRTHLLRHTGTQREDLSAPLIVSTTPAGQHHELGSAIVAAGARDLGWRVLYLGPNLPAADIAGAVLQRSAALVALSIVHPGDDPVVGKELQVLRELLPASVGILVGGACAASYSDVLSRIGAHSFENTQGLFSYLSTWRKRASSKA